MKQLLYNFFKHYACLLDIPHFTFFLVLTAFLLELYNNRLLLR
jgi:hypothetical protein